MLLQKLFGSRDLGLGHAITACLFLAPSVVAQSSGLGALALNRTSWTVTADSVQSGNNASFVLDNNKATFWITQKTPSVAPLPHTITLDMKSSYLLNGFTYLPRQDGTSTGNVGQHTVQTSQDGSTWSTVASGTWVNDQTLKTTFFSSTVARYIRLVAQTEASGTGVKQISAAELNALTNPYSTLARQRWLVSADSQQGTANSYNATEAIDGSPTTYWHSQFSPSAPALPHYFTIDQGTAVAVGGLTYLPRPPSTGANGNIGSYQVQRSTDGSTWTTVASGAWPDNNDLKTVQFAAVSSRYFRLVALTEAGNRGPYTSASEINLIDGSSQLADFTVTVDSQETTAANNSGIEAMDGSLSTFWHTAYSGTPAPLPHYFIVDMKSTFAVHALRYTPRQDGGANGNIGTHTVDISTDGTTWTNVAAGAFLDNQLPKLVNFQELPARYVRLTATSEAGNRGPWSSAAEISLAYDTGYSAPPTSVGQWGHMVDFPIVPVAAALIYTTGSILTWSSEYASGFGGGTGSTLTSTYFPGTGAVSERDVTNIAHDMFCPGLSMDFSGGPFVTGGNDAPKTSIYDPVADAWSAAPNMMISRGYQASQTLSDGRVFTIGGSWSGGTGNKNGEVFSMASGTWSLLPGCPVAPMLTNDVAGVYRADNHGWLFAWSNATVLQAGPSHNMNWYTTTNGGGVKSAGTRGSDPDAMNGNAVMYDAVAGKILTLGGAPNYQLNAATANANILTIGAPNTTVSVTAIGSMHYRRAFANAVVLPDGSVFVVGGQEYPNPFYDDEAIMNPELWNPTTQAFTVLAPMVVPRVYHSVALLMPDATVFSGGGGLCDGCSQNHFDGQIFSPPYLFAGDGTLAARPVISSASSSVLVGGTITATTAGVVSSFALVRMGSATHTVDTDQRRIPLAASGSGNTYTLTVPADPGVALPGYWMLFAINSAGVPSLAQTVQVKPVAPIA